MTNPNVGERWRKELSNRFFYDDGVEDFIQSLLKAQLDEVVEDVEKMHMRGSNDPYIHGIMEERNIAFNKVLALLQSKRGNKKELD